VPKIWLCRSGIVGQSCGAQPLDERPVNECERILGLRRSDYFCGLSEIGRQELPSTLYPPDDGSVRVVMGEGTSFAEPEHVLVVVDAAEESDEWPSGGYRLEISCSEARRRLNKLPR
jgi:hypothetical protein